MATYPAKNDNSVDGGFSWQNKVNLQHWLKARGVYDKGRECDGVWGYWTTLGIQTYLRQQYKWGYPKTRFYPGALDGQFGNMTKAAMGDAAYYLLGWSALRNKCGAGDCHISWPSTEVVKGWQHFLNVNT